MEQIWDQEMNDFKDKAQTTHTSWIIAGKPRSGQFFLARNQANYSYRWHIKSKKLNDKFMVTDKLQAELCFKNPKQF